MSEMQCVTLGLEPSFGFGDRIGLATRGHVAAMKRAGTGIAPIFPQQSIREMTRTGRNPTEVMEDALVGARAAGWTGKIGADADHLKTTADVAATFHAGFTFFTIDPSGFVDQQADSYDASTLEQKFVAAREHAAWFDDYLGQHKKLEGGVVIELSEEACVRAAVKYGRAIEEAISLADTIRKLHEAAGKDYEIELSVDETEQPTTLAEHYIIADQCLSRGMKLVSLAPRFVGDFEKGVDFKGNLAEIAVSLEEHAVISRALGPYKLSLHSGSDKLSMYAALARATRGCFHVKTAGTSYLEAVRVAARHDEALFREIVTFSRSRYDLDKATYHVSATLADAPAVDGVDLETLESEYLERWQDVPTGRGFTRPGRQILHCTFGSVLTDLNLGERLRDCLARHADTYAEVLEDHFVRHLEALQRGM